MKKFYEIASPLERSRNDIAMKKLILLVDSLMDGRVLDLLGLKK